MRILLIRKKLKKFNYDKLREECGIFGISNHTDASAMVALDFMHFNIEVKKAGNSLLDGNSYHSEKRHGLVGDHFTNKETLKNYQVHTPLVIIDILQLEKL